MAPKMRAGLRIDRGPFCSNPMLHSLLEAAPGGHPTIGPCARSKDRHGLIGRRRAVTSSSRSGAIVPEFRPACSGMVPGPRFRHHAPGARQGADPGIVAADPAEGRSGSTRTGDAGPYATAPFRGARRQTTARCAGSVNTPTRVKVGPRFGPIGLGTHGFRRQHSAAYHPVREGEVPFLRNQDSGSARGGRSGEAALLEVPEGPETQLAALGQAGCTAAARSMSRSTR